MYKVSITASYLVPQIFFFSQVFLLSKSDVYGFVELETKYHSSPTEKQNNLEIQLKCLYMEKQIINFIT